MHVQHGASIIVTDGRKALFLRNEGDAEFLNLRLVHKWEQRLEADRDLKSDAPGRTFSSRDGGTRRSSYEEMDFHEEAEVRFASKLADFLHEQCLHNAIKELIIVAPPRTLGELRNHLDPHISNLVTAEIAKDLVKHPIADIERLLACYSQPIQTV